LVVEALGQLLLGEALLDQREQTLLLQTFCPPAAAEVVAITSLMQLPEDLEAEWGAPQLVRQGQQIKGIKAAMVLQIMEPEAGVVPVELEQMHPEYSLEAAATVEVVFHRLLPEVLFQEAVAAVAALKILAQAAQVWLVVALEPTPLWVDQTHHLQTTAVAGVLVRLRVLVGVLMVGMVVLAL
jgi:hypothetical protein